MRTGSGRRRLILAFTGAVVSTAVAVVVALNLMGGESKIERRLERLYSLDDPRFVQELGVLLGPPLLAGNRYRVLRNGDEIFPPMLAAISGARRTINFEPTSTGRAPSAAPSPTRWPSGRAPQRVAAMIGPQL